MTIALHYCHGFDRFLCSQIRKSTNISLMDICVNLRWLPHLVLTFYLFAPVNLRSLWLLIVAEYIGMEHWTQVPFHTKPRRTELTKLIIGIDYGTTYSGKQFSSLGIESLD